MRPCATKATLAEYFALYPPVARKQLAAEFRLVLGVLSELEPRVLGDAIPHALSGDGARA